MWPHALKSHARLYTHMHACTFVRTLWAQTPAALFARPHSSRAMRALASILWPTPLSAIGCVCERARPQPIDGTTDVTGHGSSPHRRCRVFLLDACARTNAQVAVPRPSTTCDSGRAFHQCRSDDSAPPELELELLKWDELARRACDAGETAGSGAACGKERRTSPPAGTDADAAGRWPIADGPLQTLAR